MNTLAINSRRQYTTVSVSQVVKEIMDVLFPHITFMKKKETITASSETKELIEGVLNILTQKQKRFLTKVLGIGTFKQNAIIRELSQDDKNVQKLISEA